MATDRAMEEDIQEGKEEARYFYQLNKEEKQRREKEVSEKQESIENYYKSQYEFYKEKALKKIEDDGIRAKAEAKMVRTRTRTPTPTPTNAHVWACACL